MAQRDHGLVGLGAADGAPASGFRVRRRDRLVGLGQVAGYGARGGRHVFRGQPGTERRGRRLPGAQGVDDRADRLELLRRRSFEVAELIEPLLLLVQQLPGGLGALEDLLQHPVSFGRRVWLGVVEQMSQREGGLELRGSLGDRVAIRGHLGVAPLRGSELDVVGRVLERLVRRQQRAVRVAVELVGVGRRGLGPGAPIPGRPADEEHAAAKQQDHEHWREIEARTRRRRLRRPTALSWAGPPGARWPVAGRPQRPPRPRARRPHRRWPRRSRRSAGWAPPRRRGSRRSRHRSRRRATAPPRVRPTGRRLRPGAGRRCRRESSSQRWWRRSRSRSRRLSCRRRPRTAGSRGRRGAARGRRRPGVPRPR